MLGVEGSLASAFKDQTNETLCPNETTLCSGRFVDVITVGPRIGYAMGKWMPYVTGGYANAAFDAQNTLRSTGVVQFENHERVNGWYIGAGAEMALAAGWTIGLEYRHYDFGDFGTLWHNAGTTTSPTGSITCCPGSVDATLDTVTFRASWKFGRKKQGL